MPTNLSILAKKVQGLAEAMRTGDFSDALFTAMNEGNAFMQRRIFNENVDVQGNSFGVYIGPKHVARLTPTATPTARKRAKRIVGVPLTAHQRKRALLGRQIDHKDLRLLGTLQSSIKTVIKDSRRVTIEFENDQQSLIARGQENQITNIRNGQPGVTKGDGIKIFSLNEDERDHVVARATELILEILNRK